MSPKEAKEPRDVCMEHSGQCSRMNAVESFMEKQDGKGGTNEQLWKAIDKMNSKLNVLLGGVLLLWPTIQVVLWVIGSKKP